MLCVRDLCSRAVLVEVELTVFPQLQSSGLSWSCTCLKLVLSFLGLDILCCFLVRSQMLY